MEKKNQNPGKTAVELNGLQQGLPGEPFPLGVYPAFDDDLPRDTAFENFFAPDLRDMRPYPWGLD